MKEWFGMPRNVPPWNSKYPICTILYWTLYYQLNQSSNQIMFFGRCSMLSIIHWLKLCAFELLFLRSLNKRRGIVLKGINHAMCAEPGESMQHEAEAPQRKKGESYCKATPWLSQPTKGACLPLHTFMGYSLLPRASWQQGSRNRFPGFP